MSSEWWDSQSKVRAEIEPGPQSVAILGWSSTEPGKGHTLRALQELRQQYKRIHAVGIGGSPRDPSWKYWLKMKSRGLVDFLESDEGDEVIKSEDIVDYETAWAQGGYMPEAENTFRAASILTDQSQLPIDLVRRALREYEDDLQAAALSAFGLEVNDENRKALDAVVSMLDDNSHLRKAEADIQAADEDSLETAEAVQRAFHSNAYQKVSLNGKHSKGTIVCKDSSTDKSYLIKPGSGRPSPAKGVKQESASQSVREVAFWRVADEIGIGEFLPRADLLTMNGHEVAVMSLVPYGYQTVDKIAKTDPNFPNRVFERYRRSGILHKWAMIDYVLANPDRHGGNVMCDEEGSVFLIDHGSAFAGTEFDPAHDKSSFIPYYLRSWARMKQFDKMSFAEKLQYMPRCPPGTSVVLREWLRQIKDHQIAGILDKMGIDPAPSMDRLARLKDKVADGDTVDSALNKLWVST